MDHTRQRGAYILCVRKNENHWEMGMEASRIAWDRDKKKTAVDYSNESKSFNSLELNNLHSQMLKKKKKNKTKKKKQINRSHYRAASSHVFRRIKK